MATANNNQPKSMTPAELKRARAALGGITQAQLAERLGVVCNTVERWEMGVRRVSPMAQRLIAAMIAEHTQPRQKLRR